MRTLARLVTILAVVGLAPLFATHASADGGWIIDRFTADIVIQQNGQLLITEVIDVDFLSLTDRHGIFRDIPIRYRWDPDPKMERVYEISVQSVKNAAGSAIKYETSDNGIYYRIKIGSADQLVSGKQTYQISYTVRGVLNAFADHDELFWNVNGGAWPVAMRAVSATVRTPAEVLTQATCFQGPTGSKQPCQTSASTSRADFSATTALPEGQQLTVVTALRKGAVTVAPPILERRQRDPTEWFEATPANIALAAFVLVGGAWAVVWLWYTRGRDRAKRVTIVPEFEPPEKLRPAELGLLTDEVADPKDVTATIIDLAVRGFLTIAEVPAQGLLARKDWLLTRTGGDEATLRAYESTVLSGLFGGKREIKLSELKQHFYTTLAKAQSELYGASVTQGWFSRSPQAVRQIYAGLGCLAIAAAFGAIIVLGLTFGAGLVGVAAIVPAVLLLAFSGRMPAKTPSGAELLRRTLGFKRYMEVAETDRQRFAEKENIFSEYLPYAIVFGCVAKWAAAFAGMDAAKATSGWYAGNAIGAFTANDLSSNLSSFSDSVSSTIASTPGGSGSSGFSGGGGSGGGGGGGGGGSW